MDATELEREYGQLGLQRFDEAAALLLGQTLVDLAKADALPVVVNIRTADRTLFHAALPGSAPLNDLWARRKSNTALVFQLPSLLVALRTRANAETLAVHGLSSEDHAESGGAVPIRVTGVGVVAVATVSGLPEVEDHQLVVRGIRAMIATGQPTRS